MIQNDPGPARTFLGEWGIELENLAGLIRPLEPGECLLLAGSVAEGLANSDSDVDLLLIGGPSGLPGLMLRDATVEITTLKHGSGAEISVEVYSPAHVAELARKVSRLIGSIEDPATMEMLDLVDEVADRKLLHRVRTGIPLAGEAEVLLWRERLRVERLPEIMAGMRLIQHFAAREDAISHVVEGDIESACWIFTRSVAEMAGALLASVDETQYADRWLIRLLRRHEQQIGPELADRLISLMLVPVRTHRGIAEAMGFLDALLLIVVERLPLLAGAYARLAEEYPIRTQFDSVP